MLFDIPIAHQTLTIFPLSTCCTSINTTIGHRISIHSIIGHRTAINTPIDHLTLISIYNDHLISINIPIVHIIHFCINQCTHWQCAQIINIISPYSHWPSARLHSYCSFLFRMQLSVSDCAYQTAVQQQTHETW